VRRAWSSRRRSRAAGARRSGWSRVFPLEFGQAAFGFDDADDLAQVGVEEPGAESGGHASSLGTRARASSMVASTCSRVAPARKALCATTRRWSRAMAVFAVDEGEAG